MSPRSLPLAPAPATRDAAPEAEDCPIDAVSCCAPLATAPLDAAEAAGLAGVLKAIADPARLRVISLLAVAGESCVCDLTEPLGLSQPTVSHHLKTLADAGLVRREKRGVWAYFSLVPGALDGVGRLLSTADGVHPPTPSPAPAR